MPKVQKGGLRLMKRHDEEKNVLKKIELMLAQIPRPITNVNTILQHFTLSLHSDVDTRQRILNNTPSVFTVPLAEPLIFPTNERWEVALREIFFPTSFKNIEGSMCTIKYRKRIRKKLGEPPQVFLQEFRIPSANYTPAKLVRLVQNKMLRQKIVVPFESSSSGTEPEIKVFPLKSQLKINQDTEKVIFFKAADEAFEFDPKVLLMLGLDETKIPLTHFTSLRDHPIRITFHLPPRFDAGMQMMFVYTDIVKYSQMANTTAPIIRMLHLAKCLKEVSRHDGNYIQSYGIEFLHPEYHPVQGNNIKEVHVKLCNSEGKEIQFYGGITVLNLSFVRRE